MGSQQSAQQLYQYGQRQASQGKLNEAVSVFKKALQMDPKLLDFRQKLADIYIKQQDFASAIDELKRYIQIETRNYKIYFKLGNTYCKQGNKAKEGSQLDQGIYYKEAVEVYQASLIYYEIHKFLTNGKPSQPKIQQQSKTIINLGLAYRDLSEFKAATKTFELYIELYETDPQGYYELANIYSDMQLHDLAINHFHKALKLDDANASVHYHLALEYHHLNKLTQAQQHYLRSVDLDKSNACALQNLANLYITINRQLDAVQYYQRVIKISPSKLSAYIHLGQLYQTLQRYQEAIETFTKATQLNPQQKNAFYSLGNIHQILNQDQDAIKAYQNAVNLDPKDFLYQASLGMAYFKKNIKQKANDHCLKAYLLSIQPQCKSEAYLKQKNISLKNIEFIESSLKLIQMVNEEVNSFKQQYKKDEKSLLIIERNESKIHESVISCIDEKRHLNLEIVQSQNPEQQGRLVIMTQYDLNKMFKEYKQETRRQLDKVNQKVAELQKKMSTKEDLKESQERQNDVIRPIQEKLMVWEERFKNKIQQLQKNKQLKVAEYAKRLYEAFITSVRNYRLSKKGDLTGNAGKKAKSIAGVLSVGKIVPCSKPLSEAIISIFDGFKAQSQVLFAERINDFFLDKISEISLQNCIIQMVLFIVEQEQYRNFIQQQKENKNFVTNLKKEIRQAISKMQKYSKRQNKEEEAIKALIVRDGSQLLREICFLQKAQIQDFKKANTKENVLILVVKKCFIRIKRQQQQKQQQRLRLQQQRRANRYQCNLRILLISLFVIFSSFIWLFDINSQNKQTHQTNSDQLKKKVRQIVASLIEKGKQIVYKQIKRFLFWL